MIVFAAITPHSPLLLPSIGGEEIKKFKSTLNSFEALKKEIKSAQPDTIIFLTPHGIKVDGAMTINLHNIYEGNLSEFGDLATKPQFFPDYSLVEKLKRNLRKKKIPVTMVSNQEIDHGITIPAVLLDLKKEHKLIPISHAPTLDLKTHYTMGDVLNDEILTSNSRIAVIASADLSHRLSSDSPAGFSPKGKEFDEAVMDSVQNKNITRLISMQDEFVEESLSCGFKCILMLFGILSEVPYKIENLSYEHPFGIGHLTVGFKI